MTKPKRKTFKAERTIKVKWDTDPFPTFVRVVAKFTATKPGYYRLEITPMGEVRVFGESGRAKKVGKIRWWEGFIRRKLKIK